MTLRADLVGRLGGEVLPPQLPPLLVHPGSERAVERGHEGHPGALAAGDLVELLLHPGREGEIDVLAEVVDEEIRDNLGHGLGVEPPFADDDVAAIHDGGDRGGVGRRPADTVLLEGLDQACLREAGRRLGEVLGRGDRGNRRDLADDQRRQAALRVVLGVVTPLRVDGREAVEERPGGARAEQVRAGHQVDRRRLELLLLHLAGEGSLPDQAVEAGLVAAQDAGERLRVARERRRADRLVGLLGALGLRAVDPTLRHRVGIAEAGRDHLAGLAHGLAGHRHRVGAHVGDQAHVAVRCVDALVQLLGDGHRALGAEAELAAGLLLERRRREGRRGAALALPRPDLDDQRPAHPQGLDVRLGRGAIADLGLGSVDPDQVGIERRAVGGDEPRRDRPVLAGREASDLPLALHDEAHRDRLDSPGREARAHLAREERAQRVPHQAIDDPARLLRVDKVLVDLPRMGEGMQDGGLGDLAEGDPRQLLRRERCRLRHVPGDRLALAVEVRGQEDPVRVPGRPLDGVDVLPRSLVGDHVLGREVVLHVHPELALARDSRAGRGRGRRRRARRSPARDSVRSSSPSRATRR